MFPFQLCWVLSLRLWSELRSEVWTQCFVLDPSLPWMVKLQVWGKILTRTSQTTVMKQKKKFYWKQTNKATTTTKKRWDKWSRNGEEKWQVSVKISLSNLFSVLFCILTLLSSFWFFLAKIYHLYFIQLQSFYLLVRFFELSFLKI